MVFFLVEKLPQAITPHTTTLKKRQGVISLQKKSNKFLVTLFEGGFLDKSYVNVFRSFAKMTPDNKRKK